MDILMQNKYEFIFVLIRISVIFTFGIFYGDKRLPKIAKFAFMFLITMLVTPTLNIGITGELNSYQFVMIIISEVLIGVIIGLISASILNTLQMAGSIIDVQGGFGMAQVFDPTTQSQTSIVAQFLISFGLLFFILNDYHITFLELIINSFKLIPIGSITNVAGFTNMITEGIKVLISSISIGVCIALPIIGVIFMVDVILGISTRTMPQLNLFSVGYIVKIFTTMVLIYVYTFSINFFVQIITEYVFKVIERLV